MQIVLQPHSSYLGRMTEEYAGVVVVTKGGGNIGWGSSGREMEMMKLETYSMRRGTMGSQQ